MMDTINAVGETGKKIYDVLIIGSGPAGMGAAIYAQRAGLDCAVVDKSPISGGQVLTTYEVDNYLGLSGISGGDLSDKFREHADRLGVEFITADVSKVINGDIKTLCTDEGELRAKTIVLATGAVHSMLGVPGEERLAGMGVSYCATCDGAFFRKKTVAVVGGGDVAVEDAIFLAGLCGKVYLIHRRDELRAAASLQKRLLSMGNVEVIWDSEVTEICGDELVDGIEVRNKKTGENSKLEINGIFIAVGIVPNTEILKGIVEMDEKGYIIADETCATSSEGIYAAGDIRRKPMRQIITAVADGANAINSVQNFLNC
jgi:thioredoxin reductase (NADPH)